MLDSTFPNLFPSRREGQQATLRALRLFNGDADRQFVATLALGEDEPESVAVFDDDGIEGDAGLKPPAPHVAVTFAGDMTLEDVLSAEARSGDVTLPPNHARFVFDSCLAAVEHVHARGLVHHDVKPSNLVRARNAQGFPLF